ncbi:inorganic phosphate transporter [Sphingomonas sp. Leaf4]|uniref:inorganic phosphate transporter n=1 Tax=Sphingomonas sp. Leaf4 TaxID=2876553 RepID=UPI001E2CA104|nr:inorganic phosphate transporter [Sphingomonas sp. Leaf4]
MTSAALERDGRPGPKLDDNFGRAGSLGFVVAIIAALGYVFYNVYRDAAAVSVDPLTLMPFALLLLALVIALGFEFVNGFHDTANAVATVIYTNSMPAHVAVVWSGVFNFLGVLLSTGAVAFGIISLLPVELILGAGSASGFAMVFALLIAAIVWNLATWALGIPSSSSHTLIGSIIGVGVANAIIQGRSGSAGVDWDKAADIGKALLVSPAIGFGVAALLFLAMKTLVRNRALYEAPVADTPPPLWIRCLLIFTCTGVSFAHGSNDGQKGMGLIMLILIGTVPTAYALNRAVPAQYEAQFATNSAAALRVLGPRAQVQAAPEEAAARTRAQSYIASHKIAADTVPAVSTMIGAIDQQVREYGRLAKVPAAVSGNMRNDMYLTSEAIKRLSKENALALTDADKQVLTEYRGSLDSGTRFIPLWVKVAVAFALGLGTMVGWKRIVVTVGEKIGKTHLTYAQGASAELVAMGTIFGADSLGLPVSTTHVLSSGVAGTMAANRSGLQMATVRNLLMAWVLTLPVSVLLSGSLYFLLNKLF